MVTVPTQNSVDEVGGSLFLSQRSEQTRLDSIGIFDQIRMNLLILRLLDGVS